MAKFSHILAPFLCFLLVVSGIPLEKKVGNDVFFRDCEKGNALFNDTLYYAAAYDVLDRNQPSQLQATLNGIVDNHIVHDYACIWEVLEDVDEASGDSRYMQTWYSGELILKTDRDTGSETYVWNREHLWPTSHGFSSSSATAYTDVHHLVACQKQVNSARGDKDLAYGGSNVCIYPYGASSNCNVYWKSSSNSIEVPISYRGDTARALFYMATRYMDGDSGTSALTLVNAVTHQTGTPRLGWLCDLVQWSIEDPVSASERERHENLWKWQENRNPFVDHPEWVEIVFSSCSTSNSSNTQ